MKKSLFFFLIFTISKTYSYDQCEVLESLLIEEQVVLSNIKNVLSTRVKVDGPYKVKTATCNNFRCQVTEEDLFYLEYDPSHPDADKTGYVRFPEINVQEQMQKLIQVRRRYDYHTAQTQFWSDCKSADTLLSKY